MTPARGPGPADDWPAIIYVNVEVPDPAEPGSLMKAEIRVTAERFVRIGEDGIRQVWTALIDAVAAVAG